MHRSQTIYGRERRKGLTAFAGDNLVAATLLGFLQSLAGVRHQLIEIFTILIWD
jgi:hypothetical protein